tara:strand:- start:356 stop:676 length:321 start_codon:yes stop_codon:yes gene_type:complete
MKFFFIFVLLIVGLFFYPNLAEEKGSACSAVESKIVRVMNENNEEDKEARVFVSFLIQSLSDGYLTRTLILDRYPNLPPAIGCVVFYYELFDPQMKKNIKQSIRDY